MPRTLFLHPTLPLLACVLFCCGPAASQQQVASSSVPPAAIVHVESAASVHDDVSAQPPSEILANTLAARGRYLAAIRMYGQLQPTTANIQNRMGVASERMLMFDQAQRCFEAAVKLDPKMADAWNNLGTIFHSRGDYGNAERMYRKAIKYRPDSADAYQNLGTLYYVKQKFKKGDAMFHEAIRIDPEVMERTAQHGIQAGGGTRNNAEMHFHLACTFAQNGNASMALDYLRRSIVEGFHDRNRLLHEPGLANLQTSEPFLKMVDDLRRN